MAICSHCGLPTGTKHKLHESLKECLTSARDAITKLARYRLLDGNEEEMSQELRQETLEIAMKIHSREVHDAVRELKREPEQHNE